MSTFHKKLKIILYYIMDAINYNSCVGGALGGGGGVRARTQSQSPQVAHPAIAANDRNYKVDFYNKLVLLSENFDYLRIVAQTLQDDADIKIYIVNKLLHKYNNTYKSFTMVILSLSTAITLFESIRLVIQKMIVNNNNNDTDNNNNNYIYYYDIINSAVIIILGTIITYLTGIAKLNDYQNKIEIASNCIVRLSSYRIKKVYLDTNRFLIINKWTVPLNYYRKNDGYMDYNIDKLRTDTNLDEWLSLDSNKKEYLICDIQKTDELIKLAILYIEKIREDSGGELQIFLNNKDYYKYKRAAREAVWKETDERNKFEYSLEIDSELTNKYGAIDSELTKNIQIGEKS